MAVKDHWSPARVSMKRGRHLMEESQLMPRWVDRSGVPLTETMNLLPKNLPQDPTTAKGPLLEVSRKFQPLLESSILTSEFFKCLFRFNFEKTCEIIKEKVTYVEPWASPGMPSSAFCLLEKLYTLRLTESQVTSLLEGSVYERALGALYVRFGTPECWDWLEPHLNDQEQFKPSKRRVTFGDYVRSLFETQYYGTPFPRLPAAIERSVKVKLLLSERPIKTKLGQRVVAVRDDRWTLATVVKEGVIFDDGERRRAIIDTTLRERSIFDDDILAQVKRRDQQKATKQQHKRPQGYNEALITRTYRKRRSPSPQRKRVKPYVP